MADSGKSAAVPHAPPGQSPEVAGEAEPAQLVPQAGQLTRHPQVKRRPLTVVFYVWKLVSHLYAQRNSRT